MTDVKDLVYDGKTFLKESKIKTTFEACKKNTQSKADKALIFGL